MTDRRKNSQKTPPQTIAVAERRLRDWRSRDRGAGNWAISFLASGRGTLPR